MGRRLRAARAWHATSRRGSRWAACGAAAAGAQWSAQAQAAGRKGQEEGCGWHTVKRPLLTGLTVRNAQVAAAACLGGVAGEYA